MSYIRKSKLSQVVLILCIMASFAFITSSNDAPPPSSSMEVLDNPILFALVPPPSFTSSTFAHQLETFGNHLTGIRQAPRGGDLALMDVMGNVRLLTAEAGYGVPSGQVQTENGIAVRQPHVHWSGTKALFSMVVGGPTEAFDQSYRNNRWQIYEITNLEDVVGGATANIVKVPNQPAYNNISPIYGSDDQIIFTSDNPLFDMTHTYPQLDEYESAAVNSGIFKLNPISGKLVHLSHSPSGDFDLHLAKDGRIISTRWEHLKRDQQADQHRAGLTPWQPVNYDSEDSEALIINAPQMVDGKPFADAQGTPYELFPEAREDFDPTRDPNEPLFDFNEFLVWEITENGERHQTMNHVGRHEFGGVFQNGSKIDDPNLVFTLGDFSSNIYRETVGSDAGIFQVKEDPRPGKEGTFYGIWAREFSRLSSGRVFEFELPIGANPQDMEIVDWTNPVIDNGQPNSKGHFRNPVMLMNGTMLVSHTTESGLYHVDNPYHFQVSKMEKLNMDVADTEHVPSAPLTGAGFEKEILYYGDFLEPLADTVMLNEVDIVEITSRAAPTARPTYEIADVEKDVLDEEDIDETQLREWMIENNLALIAIRNATERDQGENQQPFNLRVPGGVESIPASGKVYDISHFQIFSAELIRAYRFRQLRGRRVIATPLRDTPANSSVEEFNLFDENGPESSVKIGLDGSIAAFVPATRALTWQTISPDGEEVVRERQWVTFAPGEIRTCEGCHGINKQSHSGNGTPQNKPQALRDLLQHWKATSGVVTSNEDDDAVPVNFSLQQNYPNPFNPSTVISFSLPQSTDVQLTVYDAQGRVVQNLVNNTMSSGTHEITFNAEGLSSGVYIYRLKTRFGLQAKRMTLIK